MKCQKLFFHAESIKEQYGLTDKEIKEVLEMAIEGF